MTRLDEALTRAGLGHSAGVAPQEGSRPVAFEPDFVSEGPGASQVAPEPRAPRRGAVYRLGGVVARNLVGVGAVDAAGVEQYRRLAAALHLVQAARQWKSVMVASALPDEGKTLTAANLALTLSESYLRKVLLIDGDLRRPALHEWFGVPNVGGLNDGASRKPDRPVPLIHLSPQLSLLTAGRPESDPMGVLASERMSRIVREASGQFDWVIVDTPPVGVLSDANLLAAMVDTVILVVRARSTPYAAVQAAVAALGRERVFGVVLNRVEADRGSSRYYEGLFGDDPRHELTGQVGG